MFLGYDNNSTGYRVFILATFKVIVSDEVVFEEDDDSHEPQNHAILQEFPFAKEKTITDEADNHSPSTQKTIPMPKVPPFESPVKPSVELQAELPVKPLAEPSVEFQADFPIELQVELPPEPLINEPPSIEEQDESGAFHGFEEDDFYPKHHENVVEGDDFFSDEDRDNVPVITNRRYPLRNCKPKLIQSMNLMDFDGQPFEPGSFLEAMGCREAHL